MLSAPAVSVMFCICVLQVGVKTQAGCGYNHFCSIEIKNGRVISPLVPLQKVGLPCFHIDLFLLHLFLSLHMQANSVSGNINEWPEKGSRSEFMVDI